LPLQGTKVNQEEDRRTKKALNMKMRIRKKEGENVRRGGRGSHTGEKRRP